MDPDGPGDLRMFPSLRNIRRDPRVTFLSPSGPEPKPSSDAFGSNASVPESRPNRGVVHGRESR